MSHPAPDYHGHHDHELHHHHHDYDEDDHHDHVRSRSDSLLLHDSGVATSQEMPSCSGADCDAAIACLPPEAVQWVITTTAAKAPGPGVRGRGGRNKGGGGRDPDGTIKQHYYPEGGWGWLVLFCALLVQVLTHGLHVAVGVLTPEVLRRFPRATNQQAGGFMFRRGSHFVL